MEPRHYSHLKIGFDNNVQKQCREKIQPKKRLNVYSTSGGRAAEHHRGLNATPIPMSGKFRAISKARLGTSPSLHLPPINVLVSDDPQRRSNLVAGFVLRCFQRLSDPDLDTRQCPWRDNRYTSGLSNTVLSY